MSTVLSIDESKHLLKLCKTGRLFELHEWIEAGNSISVANEKEVVISDIGNYESISRLRSPRLWVSWRMLL